MAFIACGSSGSGRTDSGTGGTGGGGQGGSAGIRGSGPNQPNDPVRPGNPANPGGNQGGGNQGGGTGNPGGGGSGGGGGGGAGGASIPADAIPVEIELPPRGQKVDVSFEGRSNSASNATLLLAITNPGSNTQGALSIQSVVFTTDNRALFTDNFALVGGASLGNSSDSPLKSFGFRNTPGLSENLNVLTYPTRGRDTALGTTRYLQRLVFAGGAGVNFRGRLVLKNDASFQTGVLKINAFFEGAEVNSDSNNILEAIDVWKAIYDKAGIRLDVATFFRPTASPDLAVPSIANPVFESASQSAANRQDALNVFIGSTIGGGLDGVLGISAGIPGSYFPSPKSAVVISLNAHTGLDGNLTELRKRLLGETLAHEAGHYLGLFHIVERNLIQPDGFRDQDPLGDTPLCSTINECNAIGAVRNLMFPIAYDPNTPQQDLSNEQMDVLNIQPLVQ